MIGIYKITNPKGLIYIGQSININKRFISYKKLNCKNQIKLYNSLLKYGVENHTFEVIEKCTIELLNECERYWQDYYNVISKNGLNCILTNSNSKTGELSYETKEKIRNKAIGRLATNETKLKMSLSRKGKITHNKGKKHSQETKLKISKSTKGRKHSEETKLKISFNNKGRKSPMLCKKHSEETKLKMSQKLIGNNRGKNKIMSYTEKEKLKQLFSKIIINTSNGVFYTGTREAAFYNNINPSTLKSKLNGNLKNDTNLIYC
jgi:group I intron endonuclease